MSCSVPVSVGCCDAPDVTAFLLFLTLFERMTCLDSDVSNSAFKSDVQMVQHHLENMRFISVQLTKRTCVAILTKP